MDRERKRVREQARGENGRLSEVAESIADTLAQARMHIERSELAEAETLYAEASDLWGAHEELIQGTPLWSPLRSAWANVGALLGATPAVVGQ